MGRSLLHGLVLLALSGVTRACMPIYQPHVPGEAVDPPPAAIIDARVIELHDDQETSGPLVTSIQRGVLEITRVLHGPRRVGERVPIETDMRYRSSCSPELRVGLQLTLRLYPGTAAPYSPESIGVDGFSERMFREIADLGGGARPGRQPALSGVTLRGRISQHSAQQLLARAHPVANTGCEVRRTKHYAQVGCNSVYDPNDARFKVIFERVDGRWVEVMRYPVS